MAKVVDTTRLSELGESSDSRTTSVLGSDVIVRGMYDVKAQLLVFSSLDGSLVVNVPRPYSTVEQRGKLFHTFATGQIYEVVKGHRDSRDGSSSSPSSSCSSGSSGTSGRGTLSSLYLSILRKMVQISSYEGALVIRVPEAIFLATLEEMDQHYQEHYKEQVHVHVQATKALQDERSSLGPFSDDDNDNDDDLYSASDDDDDSDDCKGDILGSYDDGEAGYADYACIACVAANGGGGGDDEEDDVDEGNEEIEEMAEEETGEFISWEELENQTRLLSMASKTPSLHGSSVPRTDGMADFDVLVNVLKGGVSGASTLH